MTERFKFNLNKRVIFPKGEQFKFIIRTKNKLEISWRELAKVFNISVRNLSDWKNEKFSLSYNALKIACKKAKIKIPKNIEIKEPFWYVEKAGKIGGISIYKKYGRVGGDPETRKQKWFEWWEKEGKYKPHPIINVSMPVKKPRKSKELAEFVGIAMGDGGISKYQVVITLNMVDDLEYSKFVGKLMKKLFGILPSFYRQPKNSVINIVISRIELVKFCAEIGLKIGNKIQQNLDIPNWIKNNNQYEIACLRGLIDTDGSIINHKYKSKNKYYTYKKIGFTSNSPTLLKSIGAILEHLGIKYRFMGNYDIRIEAQKDVKNYFKIVKTHNPKHLKRYYN